VKPATPASSPLALVAMLPCAALIRQDLKEFEKHVNGVYSRRTVSTSLFSNVIRRQ